MVRKLFERRRHADPGMPARTDIFWAIDNTDPLDRLFMQYSFLEFFPAGTMISWTTNEDNHQGHPSLAYRFDVALSGLPGAGNDITKRTNKISNRKNMKV